MRPSEVTDAEVIAAGTQLLEEKRRVTGFALRGIIQRGSAPRLKGVWDNHLAQSATHAPEKISDLPIEVEDALSELSQNLNTQLRVLSTTINNIAHRISERRVAEISQREIDTKAAFDDELQDATNTLEDLEQVREGQLEVIAKLEEQLTSERQRNSSLSEDNGRLTEREQQLISDAAELRNQITTLKKEAAVSRNDINAEITAKAVIIDRLTTAEKGIEDAKSEINRLTIVNNAITDQSNELKALGATANQQIKSLENQLQTSTQRCDELRTEAHRLNQSNLSLQRALDIIERQEKAAQEEVQEKAVVID